MLLKRVAPTGVINCELGYVRCEGSWVLRTTAEQAAECHTTACIRLHQTWIHLHPPTSETLKPQESMYARQHLCKSEEDSKPRE